MNRNRIKENLIIAVCAIIVLILFNNYIKIWDFISKIVSLLMPFIIGFGIAFLLNSPFVFLKKHLFNFVDNLKINKKEQLKNLLSIISVYILFISIISLLIYFIIPQISESVAQLGKNLPEYQESLKNFYINFTDKFNIEGDFGKYVLEIWDTVSSKIGELITKVFPYVIDATITLTTGIVNVLIGFVISIYILASKKSLLRQFKKMFFAFVPSKHTDKVIDVLYYSNKTFSSFILGQLFDACVVAVLCFVGMTIFKMPFALLISVIIGVTNIIPIIGPFIGTIPSAFILLMVDPKKSLWFLVLILVIQQIDANIIAPRILSGSTGVSGIMVMFAIILSGGLFGFTGLLLGVPVLSIVIYILKKVVNHKLQKKYNDDRIEKICENTK